MRLVEQFSYAGGRVDRSGPAPVIRGVLLCGATSKNRRRYRREAFADGQVKRYDGRPVYLNHREPSRYGRQYEDRIGSITNPRVRTDGMPEGDIRVNPGHPFAEAILHDAVHNPGTLGMSHDATAGTTRRGPDGVEEIWSLESVQSVDLVLTPASTKGLFESVDADRLRDADARWAGIVAGIKAQTAPRFTGVTFPPKVATGRVVESADRIEPGSSPLFRRLAGGNGDVKNFVRRLRS